MGRAINKTVMIAELIKVLNSSVPIHVSFKNAYSCPTSKFFVVVFFCLFHALKTQFLYQRRIADLHQNTSIGSMDITDMWEPLEEGLLP